MAYVVEDPGLLTPSTLCGQCDIELKTMGKGDFLGEFEHLVLLAVLRVDDGAYGLTVRRELQGCTGRAVTIGAVYATLDRLETKSLLRSHRTEPESRPGGRSRRQFELTDAGRDALAQSRALIDRMWRGVSLHGSGAD